MATIFNNSTSTNAFLSIALADDLVFGTGAFWTNTSGSRMIQFAGFNTFRNAGQIYTEGNAIGAVGDTVRIEILSTGVVSASSDAAISLTAFSSVINAGYVTGQEGVRFTGVSNSVVNTGTIVGTFYAITFEANTSSSTGRVTNSGTIVSVSDEAIRFEGKGVGIVNNSGLIAAERDTAIEQAGAGALTITNSGTIAGLSAIVGGLGADIVLNTGTISGTTLLSDGDDLFDSSQGVVTGTVSGGFGDDVLIGGASGDRLDGSSGSDLLIGNDGNDLLSGGAGADDLDGGAGRDTAGYGGSFSVTVDLVDASLNTGDAVGDIFAGIENLTGGFGADRLLGDAGRNALRGAEGADFLDGRGGMDVMIGGSGDDIYVVDGARDRVVELAAAGSDTVLATVSYTLSAEVETLALIGDGAIDATGNAAANLLIGNAADNVLNGLLNDDRLTGGGGADIFQFTAAVDVQTNIDTITDFTVGTDRIQLSRAIFTEVNNGVGLQAKAFVVASAARDASDRIIYDPATGQLSYDADGTGAISQVLFALVGPGLALTAADFAVFG